MQVQLKNLTTFDGYRVKYFDLHEEFGFASIVEMDGSVALNLNGAVIRSWPKGDQPEIWLIKWFDADQVVLDLHGPQVAIVSAESLERHHLGYLSELYLSTKFMVATYSEEAFYSSRPNEVEGNIISIFLRDGTFELGIRELMDKDRDSWKFEEVTAGYTFKEEFKFIAWDSPFLWTLNVSERSWKKVPFPLKIVGLEGLTGDDKTAYAIFDHRRLLSHYPDSPPFEFAVIDLLSETSFKQDFAAIETELLASGFEMSEIKFQPSSTGKIIVSDGKKAALLEFYD
ncbi:MAG: hypothetical protein WBF43_06725 [Methylocella sp.]